MAFLDNSGDIILDAVLTDTGRYRLAKGDGSFKIAKFALGDDEIDYSLYNKDHESGSAYYDLDILQSPVLEACTDNASALKSHLLSIAQTDLLFLPVIRLFESDKSVDTSTGTSLSFNSEHYFVVVADLKTEDDFTGSSGVFFTNTPESTAGQNIILDQGLDTTKISPTQEISAELSETSYIVEMDNRLGSLLDQSGMEMNRSYIDDDQMATYLLSIQKNTNEVVKLSVARPNTTDNTSSIRGPRGTRLKLKLKGSLELQTSTYLFQELGSDTAIPGYYTIDTNIRVTGATTGYRLDIPVRYVKKIVA